MMIYCEQIIVLEDTKQYISYQPKQEIEEQDRRPFDLLVCEFINQWALVEYDVYFPLLQVVINPELKKKGNRTALFFEGCLR